MKKFILAAALALLTIPAFATDFATIASSTYLLYKNDVPVCSATFVKSDDKADVLLTAAHCISAPLLGGKPFEYSIKDIELDDELNVLKETVYFLDVGTVNKANDVAVMNVRDYENSSFTVVEVATNDEADASLTIGTELIASGYPMADFYSLTEGIFVGPARISIPEIERTVFNRTSISIAPGSSGGGLYANIGGTWKLVGAATAVDTRIDFRSMFSTTKSVNSILGPVLNSRSSVNEK